MNNAELDASDEEFELPRRKRIGWNFQSFNPIKSTDVEVNGSTSVSDDIEVVEIVKSSTPDRKPLVPESSTRKEIRNTLKSVTQSKIDKFFKTKNFSKISSIPEENLKEAKTENKSCERVQSPSLPSCSSNNGIPSKNHISDSNGSKKDTHLHERHTDDVDFGNTSPDLLSKFIDKWKSLKKFSSEDARISDKLMKSYHLAHTSYTHSRKFCSGISKAIDTLDSSNIYVVIKEIVDNLKQYKDVPYIEKHKKIVKEDSEEVPEEEDEATKKLNRKLARIEKEMMKISRKINECDEEEVDFDDEDNSAYLLQERLKNQFMKLDDYYCKLSGCAQGTGRPIEKKFKYEGSRYSEINKRISAWVNKHREFPDYKDILDMVRKVTADRLLPMRPETVRVQAQEIFRDVGQILKKRREKDDLFSIYAYAGEEQVKDPAENDEDLYSKLKGNEKESKEKLDKVFQHFVDRQLEVLKDEPNGTKEKGNKEEEEEDEEEPIELRKTESKKENENEEENTMNGDNASNDDLSGLDKDESEINEISDGESENEDEEDDDDDDDEESDEDEVLPIKPELAKVEMEMVDFSDDELDNDVEEILKNAANCVTIDDDDEDVMAEDEEDYTDEDVDIADVAIENVDSADADIEDVDIEDVEIEDFEIEDSVPIASDKMPYDEEVSKVNKVTPHVEAKRKFELNLSLEQDCKRLCTSSPEIVELD